MIYTVKLDFWIDGDEIASDEEIKDILNEMLNSAVCNASNIEVLDIND